VKYGGNVHETGVVNILSKSDRNATLPNIADLTEDSVFLSKSSADQWVCWDFGAIRVLPTRYTIKCESLRSWVLDGSVDGDEWTELDRQTDSEAFARGLQTSSFAIAKPIECRYLRLLQTDANQYKGNCLRLSAVEFLGTFSDPGISPRRTDAAPRRKTAVSEWERTWRVGHPFDGIIAYLTAKHGGNVHDQGIVTITSKSVGADSECSVKAIADFSKANGHFVSDDKEGQWVCWDFHELRVRLVEYSIRAFRLKHWILEGSVDGENWNTIYATGPFRDEADHFEFEQWNTDSFGIVSDQYVDCRFIRLTQTNKNLDGGHALYLENVEFHGIVFEPTPGSPESPDLRPRFISGMSPAPAEDGIIRALSIKHGGSVHELEIVTITSSSHLYAERSPPKMVAGLPRGPQFKSDDSPGQWICWDFQDMRIRPTHYVISCRCLKTWIVESSSDGEDNEVSDGRLYL
jgi:hypothetical protein